MSERIKIAVIFILAMVLMVALVNRKAKAHDCGMIRGYVAQYGYVASIKWALRNGYSSADVAKVRQECMKTASTKPNHRKR